MKTRVLITVIVLSIAVSACGALERVVATSTGWSQQCIDGVMYLQFASGATVKYNRDGKIATCNK